MAAGQSRMDQVPLPRHVHAGKSACAAARPRDAHPGSVHAPGSLPLRQMGHHLGFGPHPPQPGHLDFHVPVQAPRRRAAAPPGQVQPGTRIQVHGVEGGRRRGAAAGPGERRVPQGALHFKARGPQGEVDMGGRQGMPRHVPRPQIQAARGTRSAGKAGLARDGQALLKANPLPARVPAPRRPTREIEMARTPPTSGRGLFQVPGEPGLASLLGLH